MSETAVNLPLDSTEIREIILDRLAKRMENNSRLAPGIAYPGFEYDLTLLIKLDHATKPETLVWDRGQEGMVGSDAPTEILTEKYQSQTPNVEREDHGLPFTVEAVDAKGKKSFRKVKIKT